MMFRLEMLPARCGDCLLLEYGPPGRAGSSSSTVASARPPRCCGTARGLRHERGAETLEIELLVVTHIDNDHIVGIIELLKADHPALKIHDIWFNGRPQLMGLPAAGSPAPVGSSLPGDLLGAPMPGLPRQRFRPPPTCSAPARATSCPGCSRPASCPGTPTPTGRAGRSW
jgi:glyoxylase-like metal-dependent hydrolase (beta-lactamase superfamily II)